MAHLKFPWCFLVYLGSDSFSGFCRWKLKEQLFYASCNYRQQRLRQTHVWRAFKDFYRLTYKVIFHSTCMVLWLKKRSSLNVFLAGAKMVMYYKTCSLIIAFSYFSGLVWTDPKGTLVRCRLWWDYQSQLAMESTRCFHFRACGTWNF